MSNFESIVDLRPLRRDDALVAFLGLDPDSDQLVELRLVPDRWLDEPDNERLVRRLQLAKLISHPAIRPVIDHQLDTRPAKVTLAAPAPLKVEEAIAAGDGITVWNAARQLIDAVGTCHRFGLAIGESGFTQIRVSPNGQLQIDPLLTLSANTDADLRFVARTLANWMELARRIQGDVAAAEPTQISARNRAAIKQRLRQASENENVLGSGVGVSPADPPSVEELRSLFGGPVLASDFDTSALATLPGLTSASDVETPTVFPGSETVFPGSTAGESRPPTTETPNTESEIANNVTAEVTLDSASTLSPMETPTAEDTATPQRSVSDSQDDAAVPVQPCNVGDSLGRYRLDRMIGRGGMGIVFAATDMASGEIVAVKVLRMESGDIPQAIRRFRKEARLLGDIQNEFVTRLFEVGFDRGHHFMAMEFVEGTNLQRWLGKNRALDPESSLRLVADIARGLVDAHARGIIHRDIKPENILLQWLGDPRQGSRSHDESDTPITNYRVKLTDFGIARYVHQSDSMEVTKAGALLGTPLYMSPEQCKGSATITPAADVYALGITLFQLLAGSPPFSSKDPMKLAAMHCFDAPPSIQRRNSSVTDPIAQIVSRALAKESDERYADASQMLREIQRVLSGEPSDMQLHPKLPEDSLDAVVERRYQWELKSSPAELWHCVANTERLNRAIGLQPVEWETRHDPQLGMRRFGSFKVAGIRVQWEEHPFEWIEGSRMGVLREFASGPFRVFMSTVELEALESGGTRLVHTLRIAPSGTLGKLLIKVEIDRKSERNLDAVYRRIDESIQARNAAGRLSQAAAVSDPFEKKIGITSPQRQRISTRCERLIARGVDSAVAARLEEYLLQSSPQTLAKIRPIALAEELSLDVDSTLDACLIAATEGLLTLMWDILCPTCRVAAVSVDALSEINSHSRCEACDVDFQSNLSDAIELVFRAHAEIRDVDVHSYCIGGPAHSPHVVAQVRLAPQERLELDVALAPGDYVLRGPRLTRQQTLRVRSENAPSEFESSISQFGVLTYTPLLRSGRQVITLTSDDETTHIVRLERQIARDNVVTATAASTVARFRELFPGQTFDPDTPIVSDDITLLASGIANVRALYAASGDAEAYRTIRKLVDRQTEIIVARGGTVTKSVGEGLLAAFQKGDEAVAAAIEIHQRLKDDDSLGRLAICIGLHRGQVLIATQNSRLDYFGSAARLAQSLPGLGEAIAMTDAVFADPQIQIRFARELNQASSRSVEVPGHGSRLVLCLASIK